MNKCLFTIFLIFSTMLATQAYEDCVIFNKDKLTDISIENNKIIDVYPLITVNNDKNTLIVHPLTTGKTRFCILKNNKKIVMFNVNVTEFETTIDEKEGFEIFTLDKPDDEFEFILDTPPEVSLNG